MKLIKLSTDHYIIVDDSEIKVDDYFYNGKAVAKMCNQWMITFTAMDAIKCKKITHSTEPIEHSYNSTSNGFNMRQMSSDVELVYDEIQQLSLSEVKELLGEVDVEKKAEKKYPIIMRTKTKIGGGTYNTDVNFSDRYSYMQGYNQALKDNKDRKYTEEDMRVAIRLATTSKYDHILEFYSEADILQSLQPPTSWDVTFVDGKLKLI